jgi:hypothetical protein
MPKITIDTDTAVLIADPGTIADVVNNIIVTVGASYRQTFSSTDLNDALNDYLASVQEGRSMGMAKQIAQHAAKLLAAGVGGGDGQIAATKDNADTLATATRITGANIGDMSLPTVGGKRWPINTPARATAALALVTDRMTKVNGARDAAITAFQALTSKEKRDFLFESVVWP